MLPISIVVFPPKSEGYCFGTQLYQWFA